MLIPFLLLVSARTFASKTDTVLVHSAAMNKDIKCVVIQPAKTAGSPEHWSVVYLLHGHGGNYAQWPSTAPQLKQEADALGILFVCPDGGFDSWYFDSPVDPGVRYETFSGICGGTSRGSFFALEAGTES